MYKGCATELAEAGREATDRLEARLSSERSGRTDERLLEQNWQSNIVESGPERASERLTDWGGTSKVDGGADDNTYMEGKEERKKEAAIFCAPT